MISAKIEDRLKRSSSFTKSHPLSTEEGLTVILSRTGVFASKKLMKLSSCLIPDIPTTLISRSWLKVKLWNMSAALAAVLAVACSSGRACKTINETMLWGFCFFLEYLQRETIWIYNFLYLKWTLLWELLVYCPLQCIGNQSVRTEN